jgi:hypothetical protein
MSKMRRKVAAVALAGAFASLALAAPAMGYGPQQGEGDPAFDACVNAVERQVAAGIQAGGGPKSVDTGPINCDHFWQRSDTPFGGVIGNGWPPPPFE